MLDKQTNNVIVGSSGVFNNLTYEMPPPNTTSVFIPAYKGVLLSLFVQSSVV